MSQAENALYTSYEAAKGARQSEAATALYDGWARKYDEDLAKLRYNGPRQLVDVCRRHLKPTDKIINIGGGSGAEALFLKSHGYTNIHAFDGSAEMLQVARERDAFASYTCEMLELGERSSLKTADFDAMILVGCFGPSHLDARYLQEVIRPVRVGGKSVFGLREMWTNSERAAAAAKLNPHYEYPIDLEAEIERLERAGKWRLVERVRVEDYCEGYPGVFFVHEILA